MCLPPVGQDLELSKTAHLSPAVSKYDACVRKTPGMVPASVEPRYDVGISKSPWVVPTLVKLAVWRSRSGHSFTRRPAPKEKRREEESRKKIHSSSFSFFQFRSPSLGCSMLYDMRSMSLITFYGIFPCENRGLSNLNSSFKICFLAAWQKRINLEFGALNYILPVQVSKSNLNILYNLSESVSSWVKCRK